MKLKNLRELSKATRNIKYALLALGVCIIAMMGVWCYMFQNDTLSTVQWIALELATMTALVIDAFVFEFFREVNIDVQHQLTRALAHWHKKKKAKAIAIAENARAELAQSEQGTTNVENQEHPHLQVVNG